jgi:hypothetical protein
MNALKAHVKNGRILVDEATDLPEGTELYLVPLKRDEDEDDADALEGAISESLDDFEAGRIVNDETVRAKVRAYR